MSEALPNCPTCHSDAAVKNGHTRHRKQNYKCRDCGRQFVENPQWRAVGEEHRAIIDRLLLEKIPLAAIARVMQVSQQWLQAYVNSKYTTLPQEVQVTPKPKRRLTVQIDEQESFVNDKDQEQWVWLAMDADTGEIVGCYVGDRSGKAAGALWDSLPAVYRQCAVCYTDFWSSYPVVLPVQTTSGSRQRHGKDKLPNRDLIAPLGNECHDWFGKPYRSRKSWKITLEQSGCSFTTTMLLFLYAYPFLFRTTLFCCDRAYQE